MNPGLSTGTARAIGNGSFIETRRDEPGQRVVPSNRPAAGREGGRSSLVHLLQFAGGLRTVAVPYERYVWLMDSVRRPWSCAKDPEVCRRTALEGPIMWILLPRLAPPPDASYWPGRRLLACADAVLWPLAWCVLVAQIAPRAGIVGPVMIALAALCAVRRLGRAAWLNHRYFFSTWRWGRVALCLLVVALVLKVALPA